MLSTGTPWLGQVVGFPPKTTRFSQHVGPCVRQVGETEPFIAELLGELTATIQDLETHQIHMFYEAVGLMISADSDKQRREQYLVR